MSADLRDFAASLPRRSEYAEQLKRMRGLGLKTEHIERAANSAADNLGEGKTRSFVIFGEPQSGKTEMMIALTARLLDEGHKVIIVLLNDNVQLLDQNLERFQRSGLSPSPKNFDTVLDPSINLKDGEFVIFCKKNQSNLKKLLDKISGIQNKIIIDDEADYASPNAKINSKQAKERTKINELIVKLLGHDGIYIGVTATPARLDLNNTFGNDNEKWIEFLPHEKYTGKNDFFLHSNKDIKFQLNFLPENDDSPKFLRQALMGFLCNVAIMNINLQARGKTEKNCCFLVHTSGKKEDHRGDQRVIQKTLDILVRKDGDSSKYAQYLGELSEAARERCQKSQHRDVIAYVVSNLARHRVTVLNSDRDVSMNYKSVTSPSSLFTIVIGGNIISRGITFDNLLAMFFTRNVKHTMQQDTYIQRARMFGSRGDYLEHFELSIPGQLYADWQQCFQFHELSLEAMRHDNAPVWISNKRSGPTAPPSIDKINVVLDEGEMSFKMFEYPEFKAAIENACNSDLNNREKLQILFKILPDGCFPKYLLDYILIDSNGSSDIRIHDPYDTIGRLGNPEDRERLHHNRGYFGGEASRKRNPEVSHHIRVFYHSTAGNAKLFYRATSSSKIRFSKNLKNKPARD